MQFNAYPDTEMLSFMLPPCAFKILIALMGTLVSPFDPTFFIAVAASTIMFAKKSESTPTSLDDIDVFAQLMYESRSSSVALMARFS